jgi:hypothetical protein
MEHYFISNSYTPLVINESNIEKFNSKNNLKKKKAKKAKEAKQNLPPGVTVDKKTINLVNKSKEAQKQTDKDKMLRILSKDKTLDDAGIEDKLSKLEIIYQIVDTFQETQIPIKKEDIEKIADLAIINNIILPNEILTVLYENRRNVGPLAPYLEPRLIDFFESKKLLPIRSNQFFKIKLLNVCIKIKKDTLVFDEEEITNTRKFYDMDSLKTACKLYIWNVKLNDCAILNTLDDMEYRIRWNTIIDRTCNIANVPLKKPKVQEKNIEVESTLGGKNSGLLGKGKEGKEGKDAKTSEGSEGSESGETPKGEGTENSEENQKSKESNKDSEFVTVEVEVDESGKEIPVSKTSKEPSENTSSEQPAKEEQSEAVEGFNENIVEHFSDSDYNFIITTALFILFLFIVYNRYKN